MLVNARTCPYDRDNLPAKRERKEAVYIDFMYRIVVEEGLVPYMPVRFIVDIVEAQPDWMENPKMVQCLGIWYRGLSELERKELSFKGELKRHFTEKVLNQIET